MGGKKRLTLKQMERSQVKQDAKGKSKKGEATATTRVEKKGLEIIAPDTADKGVIKELQKMKVLTPYTVASRFSLRLSTAKHFLEELRRQGVVTHVSSGRSMKVYKVS